MSFEAYVLRESYAKLQGLGDRLDHIKRQIDWEPFRPIVASVFRDNLETGGRPHTDELLVVRCMLLQSFYSLSDQELEYSMHDRLSFRNFAGFPDSIPDFTTIWKIRERLKEENKDVEIWDELQRQLDAKGFSIKNGTIQDASFIEADQGRKRHAKEKQLEKEGKKAEYTPKQLQHMDHDGSYSVKNQEIHFGYKTHVKTDVDFSLIRSVGITTASTHDSQVELSEPGDKFIMRDKGYFGSKLKTEGVVDYTMQRATRGHPLQEIYKRWNRKITDVRSRIERTFAVTKRVFDGAYTFVKTIGRVRVKEVFKCFAFNLYQLVTLEKKRVLAAAG